MSEITLSNIPTLRTAEDLLDWLIGEFEALYDHNGYIIVTTDDVATLIVELERFRQNSARNQEQTQIDNIERKV